MDYTQLLLTFVTVFLLPVVSTLVLNHLKAANVNTTYYEALARAGAVALTALKTSGKPLTDKSALTAAAMAGVQYLGDHAAETLVAKGVDPEALASIVGAEAQRLAYAGLAKVSQ